MREPLAPAVLALLQAPTVELRHHDGDLIAVIERSQAVSLLAGGYADSIGRHTVRYLRLHRDAPLRLLPKSCRGGSHTTRLARADGRQRLAPGQVMRMLFEHKELV